MTHFYSELTQNISQQLREQIEQCKEEIRHRFVDGKLHKLTRDGWIEVRPRIDLQRFDNPAPLENKTRESAFHIPGLHCNNVSK